MNSKVTLLCCLAAVASARPDRPPPPGYGYPAPHHPLPYGPPEPSYHAPPRPSYHGPEPTYHAPEPSYHAPEPSYHAPEPSYHAPKPSYHAPKPSYEPKHDKGMPFDFAYAVVDHYNGLDYGHNSNSDGNVVTGEYRVLLPDGRTQIVSYTADHYNGYQATVRYEGEAQYPEPQHYKPAPKYPAPAPAYGSPAPSYGKPKPLYGAPHY
ncbi:cuticle protein 7-like [Palaemon carinicauda]|uniref:cuticle protein 7-like n=1 Tax=Palaemon carinicauda TaxID=392227 RepID=UPI0035B57C4B